MLATLADAPFDDTGWVFEDKYDGFRTVTKSKAEKSPSTVATARSSVAATNAPPQAGSSLESQGQNGQDEAEQCEHSPTLGDSVS
jgi:bifunctional non-homologous end joining protein LigD